MAEYVSGIGYSMSDVAMLIVHAVLTPADLDNDGGGEQLAEGYKNALCSTGGIGSWHELQT